MYAEPGPNLTWQPGRIDRQQRSRLLGHAPACIWFTGLSGSGKSTLAAAVEERLHRAGVLTYLLDGDNLRHGLNADLDFSAAGRRENVRRAGEAARLMLDAGLVVLTALISPFRADREQVRSRMPSDAFIEVFVRCELACCEKRDSKGLYRRARAGQISDFTGLDSPYEEPGAAEIVVDNDDSRPLSAGVEQILAFLAARGIGA